MAGVFLRLSVSRAIRWKEDWRQGSKLIICIDNVSVTQWRPRMLVMGKSTHRQNVCMSSECFSNVFCSGMIIWLKLEERRKPWINQQEHPNGNLFKDYETLLRCKWRIWKREEDKGGFRMKVLMPTYMLIYAFKVAALVVFQHHENVLK